MPLALATALQFTILIFHNCDNIPTMYVTPDVVTTEATAFVVYSYCNGLGHYDAAIPCHHVSKKSTEKKDVVVALTWKVLNKIALPMPST